MENNKKRHYYDPQRVNPKLVTKASPKVLEDEIQHKAYVWFNNTYCLKNKEFRYLIFAVPNGGRRDMLEAIKMKNTGTLAGVSDMIVVLPYRTIFVEFKCAGGRVSDVQNDFKGRVNDLNHKYIVCYSVEDFKRLITLEIRRNFLIENTIGKLRRCGLIFKLIRKMLK